MSEQKVLAQVIGESSPSNELKEKMFQEAAKMESLLPRLTTDAEESLVTPSHQVQLNKTVTEVKDSNQRIIALAGENVTVKERIRREEEERKKEEERKRIAEEKRLKELEEQKRREAEERRRKDAEERRRFELAEKERLAAEQRRREEEEKRKLEEDAMFLAAQSVTQSVENVTNKFDFPEFSSEGKLFDCAREIGRLMALLSEAAQRESKTDILIHSRAIANAVKNINVLAGELANKCQDPILRNQLITAAQPAQQMSTQLKIITAVKAATEGVDSARTMKLQLVKCAKGLAGAVIKTVNAAEVAAIRNAKD